MFHDEGFDDDCEDGDGDGGCDDVRGCGKKLPHQIARQRLDPERMCSRQKSRDFPLSVHWTAVVGVAIYLFLR